MSIPIIHLHSVSRKLAVGFLAVGLLSSGDTTSAQSKDNSKPASSTGRWDVYTFHGHNSDPVPAKASPLPGGVASFKFLKTPDRALLVTESSFYQNTLLGDQTGGTVSATVAISSAPGTTFVHYDDCTAPANVRLHLATASPIPISPGCSDGGAADHTALWWSNPVSIDLATLNNASPVSLSAALDPSQWSDTCGHFGNFDAAHLAAFVQAVSHIDLIGLSFGGGCNFAFGAGSAPAGATFKLWSYSVTP